MTKAKKAPIKKAQAKEKPVQEKPVKDILVQIEAESKKHLEAIGFEFEWLQTLGKLYKFDSFIYIKKFCAFRCTQEEQHVEWIDVNTLALLNGKQALCVILNKHQPLSKARKIIQLPWDKL